MTKLFQYISDIHLEHYNISQVDTVIPKKIAPFLILAGDIGYPKKDTYKYFIDKISTIWEKIFLISGNHEYYQTEKLNRFNLHKINTIDEINQIINSICDDYPNVYFLNNSKYEFEYDSIKFVILGTPLFSNIPIDKMYIVHTYMNDYNYMYKTTNNELKRISTFDFNRLHEKCLEWLKNELNFYKETDYNILVVSHYAPSFKSIDQKYKDNKINCAFYSDLDYLINGLYGWIYGHTHSQKEIIINGVKVVNNSIGYLYEKEDNIILEKVI